jgi:predicted nuclease with TOPRIM domain
MKKSLKEILNKLAEVDEKNWKLYKKKEELERQILAIDIEIYELSGEYSKLCKEFLKNEQPYGNSFDKFSGSTSPN